MMRKLLYTLSVLVLLYNPNAFASKDSLATLLASPWELKRKTGLGMVSTTWKFLPEGKGEAKQIVEGGGQRKEYQHLFTYTVDGKRVIVQEEMEEEWRGHFGVTRWTLEGESLIHDHNFRRERIIFRPVKK